MWKDWLSFSRREQLGIVLLASLLVVFLLVRLMLPFILCPDITVLSHTLVSVEESVFYKDPPKIQLSDSAEETEWLPFNPNKVSIGDLQAMGLSAHSIVNWMKYLESGGYFASSTDIAKIYGIDSLLAKKLIAFAEINPRSRTRSDAPHRGLSSSSAPVKKSGNSGKKLDGEWQLNQIAENSGGMQTSEILPGMNERLSIEINRSATEAFMKLKGIGPVLSQRIVDFRELLGGFNAVEQLREVYGISEELYVQLADHLRVDTSEVRPLDINSLSLRMLRRHPYLNFYQARDIIEYRQRHGNVTSIEELKNLPAFKKESLKKLEPYLLFGGDTLESTSKISRVDEKK